jgi:hypothetical protein
MGDRPDLFGERGAPSLPTRGTLPGQMDPAPGAVPPSVGAPPDTGSIHVPGAPLGKDVVPAPNAVRVAQIDQAIGELRQLGPHARYEPLRVMRQAYDGPAKAIYSPSMTADFMKAQGGKMGAADVTGVLREHLATMDPVTHAANADYALAKSANDVLNATAEVERVRPKVGRRIAGRVLGTILGEHAAGIPGAIGGYLLSPAVDAATGIGITTRLKTAQLMAKLAKTIRAGDEGAVASTSFALKQLAKKLAAQGATITGQQKDAKPAGSEAGTTIR